jgi:prephenate dehydratase
VNPGADGAYQGAPGAFSEDAAHALLGRGALLLPCRGFEDVAAAVEDERARAGILPIENTLAGSVQPACDLLATRSLQIVGETVIRVTHSLVGVAGAAFEGVRQVLSHPVALAQCERFFRDHPRLEAVPVYDTAGAVLRVVEEGRADRAAIASRRAALLHGGVLLREGIEDDPENYTRFLLLARGAPAAPGAGPRKTSLVVIAAHRPGSLHECLGHFARRGIDLTRIESRPLRGRPFEYAFYLDLAGDAAEPPIAEALQALRGSAGEVRVLGSYARADAPPGRRPEGSPLRTA